jgi:Uma2 family endonuclease
MQVIENVGTSVTFSPLLKRYTLEEFWAMPEPDDRSHYELIEGILFTVPPPASPHGKIVAFLTKSLVIHNFNRNVSGTVYHPREAIYVEEVWGTYLDPDMMFVSAELEARMGKKRSSAEIVFECTSESSYSYDRNNKADTYLALGVKELWLIDSESETVEIRNAAVKDGRPMWQRRLFPPGENADSIVLEGWSVPVSEVFAK